MKWLRTLNRALINIVIVKRNELDKAVTAEDIGIDIGHAAEVDEAAVVWQAITAVSVGSTWLAVAVHSGAAETPTSCRVGVASTSASRLPPSLAHPA